MTYLMMIYLGKKKKINEFSLLFIQAIILQFIIIYQPRVLELAF